jgi:hypothetical protein
VEGLNAERKRNRMLVRSGLKHSGAFLSGVTDQWRAPLDDQVRQFTGRNQREESVMNAVDIQSLRTLGSTKHCPYCLASHIRWFGILRLCVACGKAFHWRDVVSEV